MKRQGFLLACLVSVSACVLDIEILDGVGDEVVDSGTEEESSTETSGNGTTDSGTTDPETGTTETETETTDSTETGGEIVNGCGTFDLDMHDESTIPQDPDDPEIITACTALCEAQTGGILGCSTASAACLEHCKMRSCEVCPGTLAPLVDCETVMFTGEGCSCAFDGIDCLIPAGCSDLEDQTGFCGG